MLHDNHLIEMSLRLNRSEPLFRTIREIPGTVRRTQTRDDIRLQRNTKFFRIFKDRTNDLAAQNCFADRQNIRLLFRPLKMGRN